MEQYGTDDPDPAPQSGTSSFLSREPSNQPKNQLGGVFDGRAYGDGIANDAQCAIGQYNAGYRPYYERYVDPDHAPVRRGIQCLLFVERGRHDRSVCHPAPSDVTHVGGRGI